MLPLGIANLVTVATIEEFRPQLVERLGAGPAGVIALATVQISRMLIGVADWAKTADLNALGDRVMASVNNLLDKQVIYDGVNYDTVLDGRRYWLGMNVKF
jgi:hypothetical protein